MIEKALLKIILFTLLLLSEGIEKVKTEILVNDKCENPSITKATGSKVLKKNGFCAGDLIFEDNFDELDFETWQHENTLAGGGNWEFQWYTNNRSNSFVRNNALHICPTLTSDVLGEEFLKFGRLDIHGGSPADQCTNPSYWGCERVGTPANILNPIRSARIRSLNSFSFKYAKVEIKAKFPTGDWLWPAIWLLPKYNAYGPWPASGEIDIVETRGNSYMEKDGENIGIDRIASTLHFGPYPTLNAYQKTNFNLNTKKSGDDINKDFHLYTLEWTNETFKFFFDEIEIGSVNVSDNNGFWRKGSFPDNLANPWISGEQMAPFDQEFYIIINLAVGGITYFPDDANYSPYGKPWKNDSPTAASDFWNAKDDWLKTWDLNMNSTKSCFLIDYIKVYSI